MPLIPKKNTTPLALSNFHWQDANELMLNIIDSIDLIITDPGYESLEKHRSIGTTTRLQNKWFPIVPNSYFNDFFPLAYNTLKDNTHLYMFCDQETMFNIVPMGINAGFKFHKPIIWDKMAISTGYHWRNSYECILFFEKGKRKLNNNSWGDIQHFKRLKGKEYYPTEKPVELIKRLVLNSSNPKEIVFDPFMGSGSTGVAAISTGRHFVGNDIVKSTVKEAMARINKYYNAA
jgi:site-specific DNA-methyltransferase (adenine-specific)